MADHRLITAEKKYRDFESKRIVIAVLASHVRRASLLYLEAAHVPYVHIFDSAARGK